MKNEIVYISCIDYYIQRNIWSVLYSLFSYALSVGKFKDYVIFTFLVYNQNHVLANLRRSKIVYIFIRTKITQSENNRIYMNVSERIGLFYELKFRPGLSIEI